MSNDLPRKLEYYGGVAKTEGKEAFIETSDGHPLRIPVTHEAVKRYNDFMPMKRAIEHFMVGNTDRAKEFLKECEHVNLFFDTNPK